MRKFKKYMSDKLVSSIFLYVLLVLLIIVGLLIA